MWVERRRCGWCLCVTAVVAAWLVVVGGGPPARAASEAVDFDGVGIDYVVGNKPGGGYDSYARLIAPFLETRLPGSRVQVVNRPSGGGVVALDRMAEGPADGRTLMTFNTGLLLAQLAGDRGPAVDLRELTWIGKAASEARFLVVRRAAGVASFEELAEAPRPLVFTAAAFGSASHIQSTLLKHAFDLDIRLLTGFGGSEAEAALAKGEIDGILTSESNVPPLVAGGEVVPLVRFGEPTAPALADVPDAADYARTAEQRLVVRRIAVMTELGRLTAAAPATPPAVAATLREAYERALADDELRAVAARRGMPLDPSDGATVAALVDEFLAESERFTALLDRALAR